MSVGKYGFECSIAFFVFEKNLIYDIFVPLSLTSPFTHTQEYKKGIQALNFAFHFMDELVFIYDGDCVLGT